MSTGGLTQWILDNIISLVIILLGVAILWSARGGNVAKGVTIIAGAIMGLAVLGLAVGTNAQDLGNFIVGLFGI